MVEGRISSSVSVGDGSDVGGGASILGVLSGTNGNPISVGKRCLLGANSVTGVPLGNDCIVDAGLAILEGTKVYINDKEALKKVNPEFKFDKEIYKAIELSNLNGIHYRQNSQTGQITASISKRAIKLNADLH
jgi:2,3,4,5-tetrahydropyridine-2-carboxylate N-succinyltransferase